LFEIEALRPLDAGVAPGETVPLHADLVGIERVGHTAVLSTRKWMIINY
jgi:hypothetical protein